MSSIQMELPGNRKRHPIPPSTDLVKLLCIHHKVFKLLKILHKQYNSESEISSEVIPSKKSLTSENNADQVTFSYESLGLV